MIPKVFSTQRREKLNKSKSDPAKRKTLRFIMAATLGAIVATVDLTGCTEQVTSAQQAEQVIAPAAPRAKVTPLFSKELKEFPGKEGLMISVEYPPGSVDPVHRHHAHAFIYVLEGSIVMQLKGGKEMTLKSGDTFYEGPDDIHTVGRNASKSAPARFLVFFVKDKDAPVVIPEK
jgi:quercetin dioxygenase-like cupin family protein